MDIVSKSLDPVFEFLEPVTVTEAALMPRSHDQKIEMIPITRINVLNPRSRNKRLHREIIDNIETIGLGRTDHS